MRVALVDKTMSGQCFSSYFCFEKILDLIPGFVLFNEKYVQLLRKL